MNRRLTTVTWATASVVALSTVAHAQCQQDLRRAFSNVDRQAASEQGFSQRDLQRLRQAALVLADGGFEDACEEIVDVLNDLPQLEGAGQRQAIVGTADQGGSAAQLQARRQQEPSDAAERRELAQNAIPVLEQQRQFSMNEMIGQTVYSTQSGEAIGDITDLVLSRDQRQVIIGHGGFLGMGEKRVMLPMERLRVAPDGTTYFIAMTERRIQNLPGVEQRDGRWVREQQDRQQSGQLQNRGQPETFIAETRQAMDDTVEPPRSTGALTRIGERLEQVSANTMVGKALFSIRTGEQVGTIEDVILPPRRYV